MKQMKRYWFLGVVVIMALLFAGMTFAKEKGKLPVREQLAQAHKKGNLVPFKDFPKLSMEDFKGNLDNFNRPAYKDFQKMVNAKKGMPTPEGLCDEGFYWMGGPTWTIDTDGNAMVWGAGGNLYFANANDPTHPLEVWWGDIPLRIRIHNGIALVYSFFYTYSFDVSDPLSPAFLSYGPGAAFGFFDAYPSPDDSYWILTDWAFSGGLTVWDPATLTYVWDVAPYNGGWFFDIHIDDEQQVAICGDWSQGYYEFWDISDLLCSPPTYIDSFEDYGCINNYGWFNTGLIFYKDEYLYGNYEAWQSYNWPLMNWIFGQPTLYDDAAWVSIYHVPDLHNPSNNYYVKVYHDDSYDIVSMKRANDNILLTHYQNRVGLWTDQMETHLKSGFFGTTAFYTTLDGTYYGDFGGVAAEQGGARFFTNATGGVFQNTGEFWTGGFAADVIPNGDYLYVPSGYAGLGIIDNSDPSYPVTYSYLWDPIGNGIWYAAVNPNGNYVYISDGSDSVWVVDVTDKLNPSLVSSTPYTTNSGGNVQKLTMLGDMLVIGTTNAIELVNVDVPSAPTLIDDEILANGGGATNVRTFDHPSYPDQLFLAVASDDGFLYTFYFDGAQLLDSGSLSLVNPLYDVVTVGQYAYVTDAVATIYPVRMLSQSPNIYFTLDRTGVTDLSVGYSWGSAYPPFANVKLAQVNSQLIAVYGDDLIYGYPAVFLVDVGTDPLAPALAPAGQLGVMPFDFLTGMNSQGDYVYYATDWFGTGALTVKPDFDMPQVVAGPSVTPAIADVVGHSPDPTGGWLQGTVTLSVTVTDTTSAITKVVFKFRDGTRWRTIKTLSSSTPAGTNGTYTYSWDTTNWIYTGTGPSPIRVEVTDSGCNTLVVDSVDTYAINLPPSYEIVWDPGCNEPPIGGICQPASSWVVCGNLCFDILGLVRFDDFPNSPPPDYLNEAPNPNAPIDDVSQIAYRIDGGSWILYPVPNGTPDGGANPSWGESICIDTTTLTDGSHTLEVRIADDCGLHGYEDVNGQSTWTFLVDNDGPDPYITAPMAGDLVRGSAIRVAAKMHNEFAGRPVGLVNFYLDSTDTTTISQIIATGTLIGSATTKDEYGEYSFTWDASSVPYGDHILTAVVWENDPCSCGPYRTPIVSFNLVSYIPMSVTATASPMSGNAPLSTVFTAAVTGGEAPYSYAWDFGDGQSGTGNVTSHTYTTAGSYTATVTVTDNTGATATATVAITVTGPAIDNPVITWVKKTINPFKLHVYGTKFQPGCVVKIDGVQVPITTYKDPTHVVAKKGASLKQMCPKGVPVTITVENPDGGISNGYIYTR